MFKRTTIDQRTSLIIQVITFLHLQWGLKGEVLVDLISNHSIQVTEMDPLTAYQIGDLVMEPMTLSPKNAGSNV